MIDKQSILGNQNLQWQSVESKKTTLTINPEPDPLRLAASNRVREIVSSTEPMGYAGGYGGARINADGSYEILVYTGYETADEKLKEILGKAFEADEELNGILEKMRTLHSSKEKSGTDADSAKDTFVHTEGAALPKWREMYNAQITMRNARYEAMVATRIPTAHKGTL